MFNIKKINFWAIFVPLLLCLLIGLLSLILNKSLPPKLPFFYSLPWGDKQLAQKQQLFIIPSSILLVTLINLVISWQLHSSQTFFKNILLLSSLLISLVLTISFFKILLIFI